MFSGCKSDSQEEYANNRGVQPPELNIGPLLDADSNGVRLPAGFNSRILAHSGTEPLIGMGYTWHDSPDGGATFPSLDGGWVYVSNSEEEPGRGGVGALRFDAGGTLIGAYPILTGTTRNCAGGITPWGTWLSCEEFERGRVWECDPFGGMTPRELPALGSFTHEAAAVDPRTGYVYMTEDQPDGRLYRFVPDGNDLYGRPNLAKGVLQVAQVTDDLAGLVIWHDVLDPHATNLPTRHQVAASTPFDGGEGMWYDSGRIYFSTKGDDRIWSLSLESNSIDVIYDASDFEMPVLNGVDNITVSPHGDILVAEDGDDLQIVMLSPGERGVPIVQLVGHEGSEIAGPAFDPSGERLYFSSQRGVNGVGSGGITFEVSGPFPR